MPELPPSTTIRLPFSVIVILRCLLTALHCGRWRVDANAFASNRP
jgi:hypothetical protein